MPPNEWRTVSDFGLALPARCKTSRNIVTATKAMRFMVPFRVGSAADRKRGAYSTHPVPRHREAPVTQVRQAAPLSGACSVECVTGLENSRFSGQPVAVA